MVEQVSLENGKGRATPGADPGDVGAMAVLIDSPLEPLGDPAGDPAADPGLDPAREARPFEDFHAASRAVLELLEQRLGFDLWLVTRTLEDDWIVLEARDGGYGIEPGQVLRWSDSLCSRMVEGLGPRVAPDVAAIPIYAAAPIAEQIEIGAYVGIPLVRADGSLFGTLCAVDPEPRSPEVEEEASLLEVFSRLLATLLEVELERHEGHRRLERAESSALTDELTGVFNRRGWERLTGAEEERCQSLGHAAGVVVVDLDDLKEINDARGHGAGDELLQATAQALLTSCRETDVVARLGGDEFAVMSVGTRPAQVRRLADRIQRDLAEAGIEASVGWASRRSDGGIKGALVQADTRMYADKQARKGGGGASRP